MELASRRQADSTSEILETQRAATQQPHPTAASRRAHCHLSLCTAEGAQVNIAETFRRRAAERLDVDKRKSRVLARAVRTALYWLHGQAQRSLFVCCRAKARKEQITCEVMRACEASR